MKYIKSTRDYSLSYPSLGDLTLVGFSDSDHAGNVDDRKSTSEYAFKIGECTVSWKSAKQNTVAISSTEAEYIALASCAQEALWFRSLLQELLCPQNKTVLYNDNLSTKSICQGSQSSRSKHIDTRHHFIRDYINKHVLEVKYLSSEKLCVDLLTKGLNKIKHMSCLTSLNLTNANFKVAC